jgi:hypothetical protein
MRWQIVDNQIILSNDIGCSSFELKRTTRGYTWNIKIYNTDIQKGYDTAKEIDQKARKDYDIQPETS